MIETVLRAKLSPEEAEEYDAFVAAADDGGFAQLRDYAELATSDRPFVARFFLAREAARGGARGRLVGTALVLRSRLGPLALPFAQVERGPVVGDPARLGEVLVELRRALGLRGVARLSVMPYWSGATRDDVEGLLARARYRPVDDPAGAHVRSLRMRIDGATEAEVLSGSGRKTLRYELKQAERAGVVCERARGDATRAFVELSRATMGAQGRGEAGKGEAFARALARVTERSERVACFVARATAPIGAVVVARTDKRLTLVLGATSTERLPFSKMSPPLVAAIRWARAAGAVELDLGGIPRQGDTDPKRAAIAAFKLGFSKDAVDLVREHVRWG